MAKTEKGHGNWVIVNIAHCHYVFDNCHYAHCIWQFSLQYELLAVILNQA